ncbi:hypothetical protein [Streptomyces sp. NPDC051219]|uniref:hypothetical protein n=1 Tax=Streptomyces sp. NPDC051219 TaxID=3155283 RepID=UPI0034494A5A
MAATLDTYRKVTALTGPLLPVVSFLGRLPMAMCQFGSVLLVAETSSTVAEVSFVLGPACVGVAAVVAHPAVALGGAAVLIAVFGTCFALHPTAQVVRPAATPGATPGGRRRRRRPPGVVYALCAALALQGAMFGASQAGVTALTDRLGRPEQAGLVYAAMGVMSAVVGLAMGALPATVGGGRVGGAVPVPRPVHPCAAGPWGARAGAGRRPAG